MAYRSLSTPVDWYQLGSPAVPLHNTAFAKALRGGSKECHGARDGMEKGQTDKVKVNQRRGWCWDIGKAKLSWGHTAHETCTIPQTQKYLDFTKPLVMHIIRICLHIIFTFIMNEVVLLLKKYILSRQLFSSISTVRLYGAPMEVSTWDRIRNI